MQDVEISSTPVELFKFLKFINVVGSGGEAKIVIAEGLVTVNGDAESRKRRKLNAGDVVELGGEAFCVVLNEASC